MKLGKPLRERCLQLSELRRNPSLGHDPCGHMRVSSPVLPYAHRGLPNPGMVCRSACSISEGSIRNPRTFS